MLCWNSAKSTRYDQILLCRPLPHQDRDSRYHFDRIRAFHILADLLDLIWGNGPYADKRYCSIFVRLAASELFYLHLRSVWRTLWDISQARKILKEGGFPTWCFTLLQYVSMCVCLFFIYIIYIYRYIAILWWHHLTHLKFTHTSKSVWNISNFRPFCMGLGPEDIVIVLAANSLFFQWHFVTRRFVQVSYIHNLGFRILGYITIIECNGEARRQPAKNAWNFAMDWFPVCGTLRRLIAYRLNVEIRLLGEVHSIH